MIIAMRPAGRNEKCAMPGTRSTFFVRWCLFLQAMLISLNRVRLCLIINIRTARFFLLVCTYFICAEYVCLN